MLKLITCTRCVGTFVTVMGDSYSYQGLLSIWSRRRESASSRRSPDSSDTAGGGGEKKSSAPTAMRKGDGDKGGSANAAMTAAAVAIVRFMGACVGLLSTFPVR